jgi:hypothetical protein
MDALFAACCCGSFADADVVLATLQKTISATTKNDLLACRPVTASSNYEISFESRHTSSPAFVLLAAIILAQRFAVWSKHLF